MIAGVGFTHSDIDRFVFMDTVKILKLQEEDYARQLKPIDLSNGRDFLKEDHKYDIVILCYIFRSRNDELTLQEQRSVKIIGGNNFLTSDLHSPEKWRERLINTNAKHILAFHSYEGKSEIDSTYLGELSGYTLSLKELYVGCFVSHYQKGD